MAQKQVPKCEPAAQEALECGDEGCAVPAYAIIPPTLEDLKGILRPSSKQVRGSIWRAQSTEKRGSMAKSSEAVPKKIRKIIRAPYRITPLLNASCLFNLTW